MPYNHYGYLDPIHIVWRQGTNEDPYIDRAEYLKVLNHKVILAEIPDRFTRVKIAGLMEVNYEGSPKKAIKPNEFSVNYSTGIIEFHESQESNAVNVSYKGRGFIQYPSSRIYHRDEMNDVVESLATIIDRANVKIKDVNAKTEDYEKLRDELLQTIIKSDVATTNAKKSTEESKIATDMAYDAYETTRLVFLPYVKTYQQIFSNYPYPKIGWTVQVYDSGIRYRWDGKSWVAIDLLGGNIPLANKGVNGLMSKEDWAKLNSYDDRLKERVITFVIPQFPDIGVQHIHARFPFKGEIVNVRGVIGSADSKVSTEISLQKSRDMLNWSDVLSRNIVFRKGEHFDDGLRKVDVANVAKDDIFRLEILQLGGDVQDITIEVIVKITQ